LKIKYADTKTDIPISVFVSNMPYDKDIRKNKQYIRNDNRAVVKSNDIACNISKSDFIRNNNNSLINACNAGDVALLNKWYSRPKSVMSAKQLLDLPAEILTIKGHVGALKWWLDRAELDTRCDTNIFLTASVTVLDVWLIYHLKNNIAFNFDENCIFGNVVPQINAKHILFWLKCYKITNRYNTILTKAVQHNSIDILRIWYENRTIFGNYYQTDLLIDYCLNDSGLDILLWLLQHQQELNLPYTTNAIDRTQKIDVLNIWRQSNLE